MATDRDDEIARRYRALAAEEPGAALDDAILAKSRRAVGARPGGVRRWGPPLSIAAVLVLASGVVIRMQAEKPGIETSAPVREEAVAPAAPPASRPEAPPAAATQAMPATADTATSSAKVAPARPKPAAEKKRPQEERFVPEPPPAPASRSRVQQVQTIPASTPPPPPAAYVPPPAPPAAAQSSPAAPAPQRAPMQMNAAPAAANAPAADMAPAAAGAVAKDAQRLKAEALEKRAAPPSPDVLIDRIAELRAAGRDDEADRALEDFRRAWPDYRFTEAQWEKVRRRAP